MNYGTELSGIYVYVLRILQCEINVYSGNVLVISSEVVNECGSIKKTKYKHHCHIPIFEFKGVCVHAIYTKFYRRIYLVHIITCTTHPVIPKSQ